ncbi:hypothetical protein BJ875DRAFT_228671 [Amylocarpus encephaloides]|uniref:Uncharacterized protein n=1 Tax=Amylocarpus encephaloides TaxID=45428 RepID=A0A9P7YN09_9HELO|nr:hypothetical protein BJ875DRAFT_228671 [Amylocarpus encephaloides]
METQTLSHNAGLNGNIDRIKDPHNILTYIPFTFWLSCCFIVLAVIAVLTFTFIRGLFARAAAANQRNNTLIRPQYPHTYSPVAVIWRRNDINRPMFCPRGTNAEELRRDLMVEGYARDVRAREDMGLGLGEGGRKRARGYGTFDVDVEAIGVEGKMI